MTIRSNFSSKHRLAICVVSVVLTHVLVLAGSPAKFGPQVEAQAQPVSFDTRLIEMPTVAPETPPAAPPIEPEQQQPQKLVARDTVVTNSSVAADPAKPRVGDVSDVPQDAAEAKANEAHTSQEPAVADAELPVPSSASLVAEAIGQAQPNLLVGQHFTLNPSVPMPVPPVPTTIAQQLAPSTLVASAAPMGNPSNADDSARREAPSAQTTLGPARVPAPQRLRYEVKGEARRFPYSANAELLWKVQSGHYDARLEISALLFPSRIQTSTGLVNAQGLAPTRFSDKLRTEVAAHFERDKGKVTYSANSPDTPLAPGMQDRLSVLMQLGSLIAANPGRYPQGSRIALPTVGPRDAETWVFAVGPEEALDTPHGRHPARRLSRVPLREHDLRVDLWVSGDIDYLPLQLRMTQSNGDFVLMQLKSAVAP